MRSLYGRVIVGVFIILGSLLMAEPYVEITRDGRVFTLKSYIDVERSAEQVWPYLWEFRHMEHYIDDVEEIDSVDGGEDWYSVRLTGTFPLVRAEVFNRKWIIEEGVSIGAESTTCNLETNLPIQLLGSQGYWRLQPLSGSGCRVHYITVVEVYAAGFEGLYTGIARKDGRRILTNFKRYVESR